MFVQVGKRYVEVFASSASEKQAACERNRATMRDDARRTVKTLERLETLCSQRPHSRPRRSRGPSASPGLPAGTERSALAA